MAIKFDFATPIMRGKPGESFFIPTLRPQMYKFDILATAKDLGREIQIKQVCEQYINGVRVWILK